MTQSPTQSSSPLSLRTFARRKKRGYWLQLFCPLTALVPNTLHAELPADRTTRLPAFGRSIVSSDDTTALRLNPANLGFMPGAELRWSSIYLSEQATSSYQGHALSFGIPLPLISASTALRLDWIALPEASTFRTQTNTTSYQWLTWGLALRPTEAFSVGLSLQRSFSGQASAHGLSTFSTGFSIRPANALGFAIVGQNLNAPLSQDGTRLPRTYDFGLAIRPLGKRSLELGLEAKYVDTADSYWVPRATLGVDLPDLGRFLADLSLQDPFKSQSTQAWLASAKLALHFNGHSGSTELAAGTLFGDGLGQTAADNIHKNIQTDVSFRGYRDISAVETSNYALSIRIEDTPGVREHVALLRRLWSIAEAEPSVNAVVLELRTRPATSLAHAQELRDAIFLLRKSGKRVLCHLEDGDGTSLYLCSAADRILINPAGGLRFAGMSSRYFYLRSLLEKLGIRADFVRIGDHKSAPEMFMRENASDVARADKIDLLEQFELSLSSGISLGRHLSLAEFRERLKKGPFVAHEALAAGLVDGYAFDDQLKEAVSHLIGVRTKLISDPPVHRTPMNFGNTRGIAIVYLDGDMVDGRSRTVPVLGMQTAGSYTIAGALKEARENPNVGAVVLRVETGGGSAMAADVIWREVQLTTQVKPVIVSMGSAAASGGYYVSSAGSRIFANPSTITGSIGIFYGKADITELLRKLGVTVEVYKTNPRADAESWFRPYTEDERGELVRKIAQFYDMFLNRVAEGRHLSKTQVDKVGQGRVWTGTQAIEQRLVDELGGLRQAINLARKLAKIDEHAPILELPAIETSLIGKLLGINGVQQPYSALVLPDALMQMARALGPFMFNPGDKPMALVDLVGLEP